MLKDAGIYGAIAISKGTDPALGMPSPGPIDKYIAVVKTKAKAGFTLLARFDKPLVLPTTNHPKTGNTTAVTQKANRATKVAFPAIFPKRGGKIKFPAPKNRPNNIILTCKN